MCAGCNQRLNLKRDTPLLNVADNFNLRLYIEALNTEEEAWLGKALGYVDLSKKKTCFDADMTGRGLHSSNFRLNVSAFCNRGSV